MFDYILRFCLSGIQAAFTWFEALSASMGDAFFQTIVSFFFITLAYRFILYPILGGGRFGSRGSDKVKTNKNDSSSNTQSNNMEG